MRTYNTSTPYPYRLILIPISVAVIVLLPWLSTSAQQTVTATGTSHYIVLESTADGRVMPVYAQIVAGDAPASLDFAAFTMRMAAAPRQADQLGLTVLDATNQPLYYAVTEMTAWTRGDFHGANGTIDGVMAPLDARYGVARVPVGLGDRLAVSMTAAGTNQRTAPTIIDLNALPTSTARTLSSTAQVLRQDTGDPANRVDVLIIAEGYTAAQQSQFNADADALINGFFGITPYAQYRPYFNMTRLFVPSAQSGADHPPYDPTYSGGGRQPSRCVDTVAANDPLAGQFVDTALNASYCGNGIHRLLLVDIPLTLAAAAAYPEWDEILIIVNDTTYGGSGGTFGVFSTAPQTVQIAQHEFGHTFTGLADTYETPYPGYPACSDVNASMAACEPNVTDQTNRNSLKWAHWLAANTPLPTAERNPPAAPNTVGLYQGARFRANGMYRAADTSMMRELGAAFSPVENEAFVRRIYAGWPGEAGLSTIDSTTPASVNTLTLTVGSPQTFYADLLGPVSGPGLHVRWAVNNVTVSEMRGSESTAYTFTPSTPGRYSIQLDVTDLTPLLHPNDRPTHTRTWEVYVGSGENTDPNAGVYFTEAATTVDEGATTVYVEVDLFVQAGADGVPYPSPVAVNLDLSGTALQSDDYITTPTVTFTREDGFPTGVYQQTVAVNILDDAQPEIEETLTLSLADAGANVAVYSFAAHTITIAMSDVNRQPVQLATTLETLPVDLPKKPDFSWQHQMHPSQTAAPASWYRLVVQREGVTVVDHWYEAATICNGITCAVSHPAEDLPQGLANGYYRWWVGAHLSADEMIWSQPGTFLVDDAPPPPPSTITVTPNQGRPTLRWSASPRAGWYRVYIGGDTPYNKWHAAEDICIDGICTLNPPVDRTAGTYPVWLQAWGPSGFSSADGNNGVASWVRADDLVLGDAAPALPAGIALSDPTSADPAITWTGSTAATWYQVIITPEDRAWTHNLRWHLASDLGCAEPGQPCTLNAASINGGVLDTDPNTSESYQIYVRAWGPGGFSVGGEAGYALATVSYTYTAP